MKKQLRTVIIGVLVVLGSSGACAAESSTITGAKSRKKNTHAVQQALTQFNALLDDYGTEVHFAGTYLAGLLGAHPLSDGIRGFSKSIGGAYLVFRTFPKAWKLGCGNGGPSVVMYDLIGFLIRGVGAELAALITRAFIGMPASRVEVRFE